MHGLVFVKTDSGGCACIVCETWIWLELSVLLSFKSCVRSITFKSFEGILFNLTTKGCRKILNIFAFSLIRVSPRPSIPSPRDDKSGQWMMAQRPSPGGHPSPHPSPHMDYPGGQGPPGRPSITAGTGGRQTVITDSRGDDR